MANLANSVSVQFIDAGKKDEYLTLVLASDTFTRELYIPLDLVRITIAQKHIFSIPMLTTLRQPATPAVDLPFYPVFRRLALWYLATKNLDTFKRSRAAYSIIEVMPIEVVDYFLVNLASTTSATKTYSSNVRAVQLAIGLASY